MASTVIAQFILPGVVCNDDDSDDVIVRSGNPVQNLVLVDGIEIPNINHIASQGSISGLASRLESRSSADFVIRLVEGLGIIVDGDHP